MLFDLTPPLQRKIVVVMPAYNAARTLKITYDDLPRGDIGEVILVDDASRDETVRVARNLGLTVYVHSRNFGYGGNQKTCYIEALKSGATIVVMVHPDYQYDPRLVPDMIKPLESGAADVVFGSRMLGVSAYKQGMPWWKYLANKFLTGAENRAFGLHLSEFHTGYRAYRREVLESVNFRANSDNFIFDQEIVAQIVEGGWRIAEIPVPVRYFPEASSASFVASSRYGFSILWLLLRYRMHKAGLRSQQFVSFRARYQRVS
jgi:glycosyltransferase involved in cell wall biosynthesis